MAATIARPNDTTPDPTPADLRALYFKHSARMRAEISPSSFLAGRQEVVSVLSQGPPR